MLLPVFPMPYLVTGLAWHQCGTIAADGILLTVWGCAGHHDVGRDPCVMKEEAKQTAKELHYCFVTLGLRRGTALLTSSHSRAGCLELPLPRIHLCLYPGPMPAAYLLSELGLKVRTHITFCLGSTGECLPVIPTAVCDNGAGQLPSSVLASLHQAPDCVQGSADLQGHRSTLT